MFFVTIPLLQICRGIPSPPLGTYLNFFFKSCYLFLERGVSERHHGTTESSVVCLLFRLCDKLLVLEAELVEHERVVEGRLLEVPVRPRGEFRGVACIN